MRREPVQERSRERVERILAAAAELLSEGGPEALRPTEVARRAGVPVGSVYQYFEHKAAILQVLVERYFERTQTVLIECMRGRDTLDAVLDGLAAAAAAYYELHRSEPLWRQVMYGILADPALQDLNLEDSRRNGVLLAEALLRVAPDADRDAVHTSALVVNHLFLAALQLALAESAAARQDELFGAWLAMASAEILRVVGAARERPR